MQVEEFHHGTIYVGDVLKGLAQLSDESVQCCVTSPPYWGLRDYGVAGQIGLEATPDLFISRMVAVFQEVRRVMRADGILWLNLGDTYSTGAGKDNYHLKPKDLVGIPWRVALALQADGWWLRQDIIWRKPSPMPSSVRDRCTTAHEYIFMLTKSKRYYFDAVAIAEPCSENTHSRGHGLNPKTEQAGYQTKQNESFAKATNGFVSTRNPRSVWTIGHGGGFSGAHFATFPLTLPERCIKASVSEAGCCSECGTPYERITEKVRVATRPGQSTKVNVPSGWDTTKGSHGTIHKNGRSEPEYRDAAECGNRDPGRHVTETKTVGWQPICECSPSVATKSIVLDPFMGSGTTALAAMNLGCRFVGCELNPEYLVHIRKRLKQPTLF